MQWKQRMKSCSEIDKSISSDAFHCSSWVHWSSSGDVSSRNEEVPDTSSSCWWVLWFRGSTWLARLLCCPKGVLFAWWKWFWLNCSRWSCISGHWVSTVQLLSMVGMSICVNGFAQVQGQFCGISVYPILCCSWLLQLSLLLCEENQQVHRQDSWDDFHGVIELDIMRFSALSMPCVIPSYIVEWLWLIAGVCQKYLLLIELWLVMTPDWY